jgi:heptosyltransferase-2
MTHEGAGGSRLVVGAPNWLGDAVLALPSIAAIRQHFADAHLTIAARGSVAGLFRQITDARPDDVVELPRRTRDAVTALKGGRFDLGIVFPNSFRSAWVLWRAGVPARWGFARGGRRLLLTRVSPNPRRPKPAHQADDYRALVRGLGVPVDDAAPPRVTPTDASRAAAAALLSRERVAPDARLVGVSPGAAYGQAKQWPADRMAALVGRLVRDGGVTCLVLGAEHDRPAARAIESSLRTHAPDAAGRVVDLVGRTSLEALVGLAARCAVFVSNDSGAMHVAAAVGRPVVALFGPTDERATGPVGDHDIITQSVFCRPCLLRDCPIDHRCMKRITVDMVATAVFGRLARVPAV